MRTTQNHRRKQTTQAHSASKHAARRSKRSAELLGSGIDTQALEGRLKRVE